MSTITFDSIPPDETPFCGVHHRHPTDIAGFAVVLTQPGRGRVRDVAVWEDVNVGTDSQPYYPAYGEALALAREIRAIVLDRGQYARIDVLYEDGCRGIC